MSNIILHPTDPEDQKKLREEIQTFQAELEGIQKETLTFKTLLQTHLSDLMIEEQELFILYKKIQKAKKAKRLEQKKRGKNYKEPKEVKTVFKKKKAPAPSEDQKEKKRLYREAILHIHPDKFSMDENQTDIATEITSRLIEIYKTGSLAELQAIHAQIFLGDKQGKLGEVKPKNSVTLKDIYLQQEKDRIEKAIHSAKQKRLYKVMNEYEDPMDFMAELKAYYEDRIAKLKKRTRKGL